MYEAVKRPLEDLVCIFGPINIQGAIKGCIEGLCSIPNKRNKGGIQYKFLFCSLNNINGKFPFGPKLKLNAKELA